MSEKKDLIVLGSGPGGYIAAIRASQLGRKVSIIEREALGGVCLNWGCIPSKALLRSAQLCHDMQHADEFGFEVDDFKIDFPKVIGRSRTVASKLSGGVNYLMKKNKVEIISGNGTLLKGNKIKVSSSTGDTEYSFNDIIIGTGARPRTLPGISVDGEVIHTSRTILENKRLPQKMLIIGAGAIGIEFAYFFNAMGVNVTVVEMVNQVLPPEDTEIANELQKSLQKQGIQIKTSTKTENLKQSGKTVTADLVAEDGSKEPWTGDCCLLSIGVIPNTEEIGLEEVGIKTERGFIETDGYLRTNVPNHFAIGDCAGGILLAHKASHEGIIAAETACGQANGPMHYDNIASCTYCQPQVASVGLTERALKEKGIKYKVGKIPFQAIGKAIAIGEPEGMIKVLISEEVGEVLGVHIIHSEATELITEAAIIRSHEGIAASVVDTIHPHPTLSEAMSEAMALALGRPLNY
jgi:dihydrolipoamide dehydrogenase